MSYKLNYSNVLVLILLGPSFFSVVLGVMWLDIPVEALNYAITIILLSLIIVSNNFRIKIIKQRLVFVFFLSVFFITVCVSVFSSISSISSVLKFEIFIYLIAVKIFFIIFIDFEFLTKNNFYFLCVLKNTSVFILCFYFLLFYFGFTYDYSSTGRHVLLGIENPIWFSRYISDLMLIVIFFFITTKNYKIIYLLVIIMGGILLLESASRGPIFSLATSLFFVFLKELPKIKRFVFLGFALVVLLLFGSEIIYSVSNWNSYSITGRTVLFQQSIDLISSNIYGYGFGSFGVLILGEDVRLYPHNIFLEIFIELGLYSLIIFIILIIYGLNSNKQTNIFFYLFLSALINAQFSGDLTGNSMVFVYMFLSMAYQNYSKYLET